MTYTNNQIADVARVLKERFAELTDKPSVLRAPELRGLYAQIPLLPADQRAAFGAEINALKLELEDCPTYCCLWVKDPVITTFHINKVVLTPW